ncbi:MULTISPECIES: heavy-metal-associated domain-containing protein [unclassified Rathayibacter]|uniref:heavy-metal-associated domain-containing protein n=1 Tax=unclassified Rathayibacter TaxID=2609250 RepID=UPI00188A9BC5|nr:MULTISPECIES: heavy-metal-associated domain-containing protein [unclassified Rathayibacter]MBF4463255.1 heavy-metal-associated domain-containing protein [Rathayibacter sp. VKM Ac-2879]MBF4504508.1 heavy-metal-associated domain-containing protein [Rathayibacter sp. VKM Ac-2878]
MTTRIDLGLTAIGANGCGGTGACACGGHSSAGHSADHGSVASSSTQSFGVAGMTCEHCVRSVTEELAAYPDVHGVDVSLVPDGVSTVTVGSSRPLSREEIAAAVADAGYRLAPLS